MRAIDQEVLEAARRWLAAGEEVWLCTIVAAVGSSPRPVGSMLACNGAGGQCGSLSGGCIEDDLLERVRSGSMPDVPAQIIEYGVSAEENERLGLPCGGRLRVLLQRLGQVDVEWLDQALTALAARECIRREVTLASGACRVHPAGAFAPLEVSPERVVQSLGPRQRMLLVGAGQLSQSLAELALAMDYEVLVSDPRPVPREQWAGPRVPLLAGMPDDAVREHITDPHAIVITLTHDPRIDDMALMEALDSPAWYVGALGSRRTTDKRLERLRQLGFEDSQLAALHAPVGLDIGSKTPLEIAVAIMAELTSLQRRRPGQ
ncbi:XdhC family protein [Parahaliea mediterranea]|uniref:XdhC family protein n=1 Tax=Parahaliea mediterranea TaxID=651086 RepID=A0A939ILR3_9GAMM|nr:XdhC family protein [Parahaliea mediterranea]MBN7796232.1 XdhC family protein [Parahaliea mediterranea]